ncbi:hypothetical protein PpBr36_03210 [Pyricularia pennisetigena]|uniref:hypothetical protein n=1 Tax=Pyricularia pennisetigena TaxID=1578925 RepID=UPI001154A0EF|nr:hypothetical protein PpBr36_03210 [Pyricularia pennisetigena]TLS30352.1 hypothetical protein PpBr36_03210 [Pyricularia pennisetigena]
METTYKSLADRVVSRWRHHVEKHTTAARPDQPVPRLLIALAGPPGSGKTTIATNVVKILEERRRSDDPTTPKTTAVSADGFHLPLETLRALPNAEEAIARRGAPWTFDGLAAVALVRELGRTPRATVSAPTFDHAVKDPVPDGLSVGPDVDVCLLEGNYLLCDEEPWSGVAAEVHDRWLVSVAEDLARARVAARHVAAGIEPDLESALKRTDGNDMVNGRFVMDKSRGRYDLLIESVEETRN